MAFGGMPAEIAARIGSDTARHVAAGSRVASGARRLSGSLGRMGGRRTGRMLGLAGAAGGAGFIMGRRSSATNGLMPRSSGGAGIYGY